MARLNDSWKKNLRKEDFEKYPIWVWDDANEGFLPISDSKYTTEYGTLFIKSVFESDGHFFDGYLVGFDFFYAFGLFLYEQEVGLNINMPEFVPKFQTQIFKLLNCTPFLLFPMRYKSSINFEDGTPISGVFELRNGKVFCVPDNQELLEQKRREMLREKYGIE
jgi:hypothetical protein